MSKVNEFEHFLPYEIDLDHFSLQEGTNKVLVKTYQKDTQETIGGIVTEGLESFNFAEHTERRGRVIKTVRTVVPGQNGTEIMLHDCDVEIQEGDEVYFNFHDNVNSYIYTCNEEVYKLIPYSSIIMAIRDNQVIMCNGYVLIEDLPVEQQVGNIYIPTKKRANRGIVRYIGSLNKRYFRVVMYKDIDKYLENNQDKKIYSFMDMNVLINHDDRTDQGTEGIKEGDEVFIDDVRWVFPLEEYAYARFDDRKILKVCPRHCITTINKV